MLNTNRSTIQNVLPSFAQTTLPGEDFAVSFERTVDRLVSSMSQFAMSVTHTHWQDIIISDISDIYRLWPSRFVFVRLYLKYLDLHTPIHVHPTPLFIAKDVNADCGVFSLQ